MNQTSYIVNCSESWANNNKNEDDDFNGDVDVDDDIDVDVDDDVESDDKTWRAVDMPSQLRVHMASPVDPIVIPSPHVCQQTSTWNSISRWSYASPWFCRLYLHMHVFSPP